MTSFDPDPIYSAMLTARANSEEAQRSSVGRANRSRSDSGNYNTGEWVLRTQHSLRLSRMRLPHRPWKQEYYVQLEQQ